MPSRLHTILARFLKIAVISLLCLEALPAAPAHADSQLFVVTSTADHDDGVCDADCTLREAMTLANANPGKDTINFNIPGSAPHVIDVASRLPAVTDPVIIDASTNPDWNDKPVVALLGNSGVSQGGCFTLNSGDSTIRGFVISCTDWSQVFVDNSGSNVIEGNYVGTNAAGTAAAGVPAWGIYIQGGDSNVIGGSTPDKRNVISGLPASGIVIVREYKGDILDRHSTGTIIQGNYIGTSADGRKAIPNLGDGILDGGDNTLIGGDQPGEGNLLSGNNFNGIWLWGTNTTIQGNLIGTDVTGTKPLRNENGIQTRTYYPGMRVDTSSIRIGGDTPGARNVISGNRMGIHFTAVANTLPNFIQGNYIGTDVTGTQPLGNWMAGIAISAAGGTITIGGENPGEGNIIANNGFGLAEGDGPGDGIDIFAFNNTPPTENAILGNLIYGNARMDIYLGGDGPTVNDFQDPDIGPNYLQNYPVVDGVVATGLLPAPGPARAAALAAPAALEAPLAVAQPAAASGATTGQVQVNLSGHINTTPGMTLRLEFFTTDKCDKYGHGRAKRFLGSTSVSADSNGDASYAVLASILPTEYVSATATDVTGNTSEFSACFAPPAVPKVVPKMTYPVKPLLTALTTVPTSWNPAPGAYGYEVQLARDKKFNQPVLDDMTTSPGYTLSGLTDGLYYLRVRPVNAYGVGSKKWSAVKRITVDRIPPNTPALKTPLGLSVGVKAAPSLVALKSKTAVRYLFQVATSVDALDAAPVVTLKRSTYKVSSRQPLLAGTTYYWRVAAVDKAGNVSAWSAPWSFTTAP